MTTEKDANRVHERARWVVAASLLVHEHAEIMAEESAEPPIALEGCRGALTEASTDRAVMCVIEAVTHNGLTVSIAGAKAPEGIVELTWNAGRRNFGRHRFVVLAVEETGSEAWLLTLRWIGLVPDLG